MKMVNQDDFFTIPTLPNTEIKETLISNIYKLANSSQHNGPNNLYNIIFTHLQVWGQKKFVLFDYDFIIRSSYIQEKIKTIFYRGLSYLI